MDYKVTFGDTTRLYCVLCDENLKIDKVTIDGTAIVPCSCQPDLTKLKEAYINFKTPISEEDFKASIEETSEKFNMLIEAIKELFNK